MNGSKSTREWENKASTVDTQNNLSVARNVIYTAVTKVDCQFLTFNCDFPIHLGIHIISRYEIGKKKLNIRARSRRMKFRPRGELIGVFFEDMEKTIWWHKKLKLGLLISKDKFFILNIRDMLEDVSTDG